MTSGLEMDWAILSPGAHEAERDEHLAYAIHHIYLSKQICEDS